MKDSYGADFGVITALQLEHEALLRVLPGAREATFGSAGARVYHVADVPTATGRPYRVVCCMLNRMGNVESAIATADLLTSWRPRNVAMVGIAGGLRPNEQQIGDVVIARDLLYFEEQKITPTGPRKRVVGVPASPILLNRASSLSHNWQDLIPNDVLLPHKLARAPKTWVGAVASGEKVFAAPGAAQGLLEINEKILAVEMESWGVASAALASTVKTNFLSVRGISDLADNRKNDLAQPLAAMAAAAWFISFLSTSPVDTEEPLAAFAAASLSAELAPVAVDEVALYDEIRKRVDINAFKTLCFLLRIDYDEIPGDTKSVRVMELVRRFQRRGELLKLAEFWVRARERDDI